MKNVAVILFIFGITCVECKFVRTYLNSKWSDFPVLLEASEYIAHYDPQLFWKFIAETKLINYNDPPGKGRYDVFMSVAEKLLSGMTYDLLKLSLSTRTYSPTIEMYNQIAKQRIKEHFEAVKDCSAFVEIDGADVACSVDNMQTLLKAYTPAINQTQLYQFDHVFPGVVQGDVPQVILYAEIGSREFAAFHDALVELATHQKVKYILRHYVLSVSSNKVRLSGYGVQLAVKSTEYKAMDDSKVDDAERGHEMEEEEKELEGFMFGTLKERYPELESDLGEFKTYLKDSLKEIVELKAWQLQDLGFQASQRIMSSADNLTALETMKEIAQYLPVHTRSLYRVKVKGDLKHEIKENHDALSSYGISAGSSYMLINGMVLDGDSLDVFSLQETLQHEARLVDSLYRLGVQSTDLQSTLSLKVHSDQQSFVVDTRSDSVVFINDLENDAKYRSWPKSVGELLRPVFPGMIRQIAKNMYTTVMCLDPMATTTHDYLDYVTLFLQHTVPVRFGVLLVPQDDPSIPTSENPGYTLAKAFYFINQTVSAMKALNWLITIIDEDHQLNHSSIVDIFMEEYGGRVESAEEVFGDESVYTTIVKESVAFYQRKGLGEVPQVLVNGVTLDPEEDFESALVSVIQQLTPPLQQEAYRKIIRDNTDIYAHVMSKPSVLERLNHYVTSGKGKILDLSGRPSESGFVKFASLPATTMSATVTSRMNYFFNPEAEFVTTHVTVWLAVDLATLTGRQLFKNGLEYMSSSVFIRLGVVHNIPSLSNPSHVIHKFLEALWKSQRQIVVQEFMSQFCETDVPLENLEQLKALAQEIKGFKSDKLDKALADETIDNIITSHMIYSREVLMLREGQQAFLSNGRIIGPFSEDESFNVADFKLLESFERMTHADAVHEKASLLELPGIDPDEDTSLFRSDLVMKISSVLRSAPKKRRIVVPPFLHNHSAIKLPPEDDRCLQLVAFVDPLSEAAQKMLPLIEVLYKVTGVNVTIVLNPKEKVTELPPKSFYQLVLEPELSFHPDHGLMLEGPSAMFMNLPESPLLTLSLQVPHAWFVEPIQSVHDLDNIHLAEIEHGVSGAFELEYILIEGHCSDGVTGQPTQGLQFVLGTQEQSDLFDTIVMANLGYFQLKANPGAWVMRLREGKSKDIYHVVRHEGTEPESVADNLIVTLSSFTGKFVTIHVTKRPGMENVDLLSSDTSTAQAGTQEGDEEEEATDDDGYWESLTGLFGDGEKKKKYSSDHISSVNDTINIFSVASGHLYERFLRIMMLSVLKHTKNPVKFWFLKNFLSPNFKDFIPHMAKEYGFEYELVQYKWPHWLHQQTVKQRIIWGYKILFLDVLFPLSVKKIIFVDADQIVREDMKELVDLPLEGAPYGYTPFCDDREDMEGFRFWKRGYWSNHLGNRRYHISALYVIDLVRFRQVAAGDRLRGQYQMLSQDPNSLSNLDQDLPNNMIHQVQIKSLPQEWLWCETWCSQESKVKAKTIDLCNNPLTKEPKLTSAVRIVPEWTSYDTEIKQLQDQFVASNIKQDDDTQWDEQDTTDIRNHMRVHEDL